MKTKSESQPGKNRPWGFAWLGLAIALALHVTDEALTGFLPLYNSIVTDIRGSIPWLPLPVFTFRVWLGGLIAGVMALLVMSPLAFAGHRWLRYIAYPLSVLMIFNSFGHIGASIYWGMPAPGVYSSPVLLLAATALLVTTIKSADRSDDG